MTKTRTYSRFTTEATKLLGSLVKLARKERKLTTQDLADRAGISRSTLQRIEKGDLKCEIGLMFEVASIVGVKLFNADHETLDQHIDRTKDKIALLPKNIHKPKQDIDDDF